MNAASTWTTAELQAIILARELADGEVGIVGTASDVQVAACNLARAMHAPSLSWVSGPLGTVNADAGTLLPTADARLIRHAEAVVDLSVMIDVIDWRPGFFDFAILGAMQVDRYGNLNTVVIGDHARPKVRGPGVIGTSPLAAFAKHFFVLLARHDRQNLVERVDFISAVGHYRGGSSRASELGLETEGPRLVVTPLAVLDFHPVTRSMQLRSVHPGVSVAEVVARTGFALDVPPDVATTPPPTGRELAVLRRRVDRTGILRRGRSDTRSQRLADRPARPMSAGTTHTRTKPCRT
jgi:glutaconate CoA-transferase subunit B